MSTTEILTEARDFIADPAHWCQGDLAVNRNGVRRAGPRIVEAERCCAIGSVQRAAYLRDMATDSTLCAAGDALDAAATELYPESAQQNQWAPMAWVNDRLGHGAVLAVFDRAIRAREAAR